MADESIYEELSKEGLSRRSFMKFCGLMAGAMGFTQMPTLGVGKAHRQCLNIEGVCQPGCQSAGKQTQAACYLVGTPGLRRL